MQTREQLKRRDHVSRLSPGQTLIGATLVATSCAAGMNAALAADGAALFQANCAPCHSIGEGPRAGPDLRDVIAKRGRDGTLRATLDPGAAGLQPTMPNLGLVKAEVEAIVAYIDTFKDAAAPAADTAAPVVAQPADIERGRDLFEGRQRFAKGGASCNACHDVNSDTMASGGTLASELTLVFSRMGAKGLHAMLAQSPFPVMQAAYAGRELSEAEIAALVAFFEHAGTSQSGPMAGATRWKMFAAACGGVLVLLAWFSFAGRKRKRHSVNQDIFDRQVTSE